MIVFGKLQTRKKNINACKNIKIIHYRTNGNTKGYLQMIECKDSGCSKGKLENNMCIIEGKKIESLLLRGRRSNKMINGEKYIVLEQNKQNILKEIKNLAKRISKDGNETIIELEPQILVNDRNERKMILDKLLDGGVKKN